MEIVAHRGLHVAAPENSLGAIQAALDAGLKYIEVDARASRDGTIVLMHDARVDRTTDRVGRLRAMDASAINALRLSDGSRVPRLEEALALTRGRGVLCIDVKEAGIGHEVVRLILAARAAAEVWSSHQEVVARASDAGLFSALVVMGVMPGGGIGDLVELGRQLGAEALSFFPADLEPRVAEACRSLHMPFMSGTPNDLPTWRALAAAGIRAIITDNPLHCADALGVDIGLTGEPAGCRRLLRLS